MAPLLFFGVRMKYRFQSFVVCWLALVSLLWGSAAAEPRAVERLAGDPTWTKLIQYKDDGFFRGDRSAIITKDFFLAETGNKAPLAELLATLEAMQGPLGENPDEHVLCRFPARAIWLDEQLSLGVPDPFSVCPDLAAWSKQGTMDGVSVLFVAGYFSNPGSAFGHILMRLHAGDDAVDAEDVLDTAINYGAADSEDDPLVPYIYRGLTGHYRSTYSTLDFYHHSERFREQQLRDLWQYRLDLSPRQVRLFTAHVWELLRAHNRYYFLRQNCAYRIAAALELVVDRELTPSNKVWMAPADVFEALTREEPGKRPVVKEVKRLASRETQFTDGYRRLAPKQKRVIDKLMADADLPVQPLLTGLSPDEQAQTLDVVLDYFAFADDVDPAQKSQALAARFVLPPSQEEDGAKPLPPHAGQAPSMWQVQALSNDELGAGVELRVRPAYFDFLSTTEGTAPFSELSMADLRLVARDDALHLRQLEIVRVTALKLQTDGAPNRDGRAYRFRTGAETRHLGCDDCLVGFVEAGLGEAVSLAPNVAAFGLLSARAEAGDVVNSSLSGVGTLGLVVHSKPAAMVVEAGLVQGIDHDEVTIPFAKAELRLGRGTQWDVRLRTEQREALEFGFAVSGYW